MLNMDLSFLLIAGFATVFAGISKGGFGSAASFASASILALVVDPGLALGIMLPLLLLIDGVTLRPFWRAWHGPSVWVLTLSGIPGAVLGAWVFTLINADGLRILIGVVSVGFVVLSLSPKRLAADHYRPQWVGVSAGFAAGFTTFVSHAGGPIAAVYLLGRGLAKTEYHATTVIVFGALNVVKAILYAEIGLFTWETAHVSVLLVPFALLGAWAGVRLHWAVPERLFFGLTYVMLMVTGIKLIWDGFT